MERGEQNYQSSNSAEWGKIGVTPLESAPTAGYNSEEMTIEYEPIPLVSRKWFNLRIIPITNKRCKIWV